jgi:arginine utilization protein RocB
MAPPSFSRPLPGDKTAALVARWRADKPTKKPILILGHMDVVEAKREDWTFDPFVFREEGGYFLGRGTADMKNGIVTAAGSAPSASQSMTSTAAGAFRPTTSALMASTSAFRSAPCMTTCCTGRWC